MKLDIGSGVVRGDKTQQDIWINLDLYYRRGVSVLGDVAALPFKGRTFEVVHCIHVIEHLTRKKIPMALAEIARITKSKAFIEVPDFKEIINRLKSAYDRGDTERQHVWRTSIYGRSERPGMAHHFGFDEGLLKQMMLEAGFNSVERLTRQEEMISPHWKSEPVLLVVGYKE